MHLKEVYRNNAAAVDTLLREKMTALQIPGITVSLLYGGDTVYQTAMGIRVERHTLWTAVRCLSRRL